MTCHFQDTTVHTKKRWSIECGKTICMSLCTQMAIRGTKAIVPFVSHDLWVVVRGRIIRDVVPLLAFVNYIMVFHLTFSRNNCAHKENVIHWLVASRQCKGRCTHWYRYVEGHAQLFLSDHMVLSEILFLCFPFVYCCWVLHQGSFLLFDNSFVFATKSCRTDGGRQCLRKRYSR